MCGNIETVTHQTLRPLSDKGVILHHFHWHRMVCDEGHEHGELPSMYHIYHINLPQC
jgi:hypothetical protein